MPTRFSTEAANADFMGEDDKANGAPAPERDSRGGAQADERKAGEPKEGEAKPGKDINAPGFVKDKDAGKP